MSTSTYLDYKKNTSSSGGSKPATKVSVSDEKTSSYSEYLKNKKPSKTTVAVNETPVASPIKKVKNGSIIQDVAPTSAGPRRSLVPKEPTAVISQKDPNQETSSRRGIINTVVDKVSKIGSSKNIFTTSLDRGISMAMNATNPFMQAVNSIKNRAQDKKGEKTNYATASAAHFAENTLSLAQDIAIRGPRGVKNIFKKDASKSERINGLLDIGLAGVELATFAPVAAFNAQKAGIEATGKQGTKAGKMVDKGFEGLMRIGSWGAGKALNAIPDSLVSPGAKAHLERNFEEVGGQLSMLLSTVLLHKAVNGIKGKKAPTELNVGDTMKKMLGLEEKGIPTKEMIDRAYKETMESFKDKPDFEGRASVATTAYRALHDYHDLSPVEFQQKWVETTKILEERLPELREEIQKNMEKASVENEAAQTLDARSAPIGDTEAGYRTVYDLKGNAPDIYMAEAVTNVKRAIEAEAGKVPVRVEDNRASDVPARMDMQTGEITVNPTAILKLVETRESMGDVRPGESRADLEQRVVREEISRQQVAFEQMTPADKIAQKVAQETGIPVEPKKEQAQAKSTSAKQEKPVGDTPSKVGESIQAKAIERGITEGFEGTALYEKKTIEGQAKLVSELISADTMKAERIVRGEDPLPAEVNPGFFIKGMEDYISTIKDLGERARLNYELANSSLVSETSAAAQTLRFLQERTPDSAMAAIQRAETLKKESAKKLGKNVDKERAKAEKALKKAEEKTAEDAKAWSSFIDSIQC